MRLLFALLAGSLLTGVLAGCESLAYLGQSVMGHYALMDQRQSVDDLLQDDTLAPQLRAKLSLIDELRRFATDELRLPDNGSYQTYVELGRPYVTWTVVATPELSMKPYQSCFPVIGCVSYRGYFTKDAAQAYADNARNSGADAYVGGAGAYSTLGWFADPVLSSMTRRSDAGLAAILFHELAHQKLYVPGDTTFNESYATVIERLGVAAWFESREPANSESLAVYNERLLRRQEFLQLVAHAKGELQVVYASTDSADSKLRRKAATLSQLRQAYAETVKRWGGESPYAAWFSGPLNNAKLALVGTYSDHVPALMQLYREAGSDMAAFHRAAATLGELSMTARQEQLLRLANDASLASDRQTR